MKKNTIMSLMMGLLLLGLTDLGATSLYNDYEKQIAAVKQSYYALLIGNQEKDVQSAVVDQDTKVIKYEVQLAAVKKLYSAIR